MCAVRILLKSFGVSVFVIALTYAFRNYLNTGSFIADAGGISVFASIYGTLYGIAVALVLLEVLSEFNKTSGLIDREATGLERLFRLTLYFGNNRLTEKMRVCVKKYIDFVIKDNFESLASGKREKESSKAFREIADVVKNIKIADDRNSVVFHHVVHHYGDLSQTRTDRITYSLTRLPVPLKVFLYSTSLFTIFITMVTPFANMYYGFITTGALVFIISTIFQIIEDLDNPFMGFWNITTEPFKRAWKHIEEDY